MRRIIAGLVLGSLGSFISSPVCAGPLADSVSRAAQVQPRQLDGASHAGDALVYSGLALLGTGLLLDVLSFTALKNEAAACIVYRDGSYNCAQEESTNKGALIAGMLIGTTGGLMMDFGFARNRRVAPALGLSPHGITAGGRVRF